LSQALSGLEYELGPAEQGNRPLYYRTGHTDTTNAFASVVGVLAALTQRDRIGQGQAVWTSLINAATYVCSDVYLTEEGPINPPRLDKHQMGFGPLYRLYETNDGWLQVAAPKEEHWPVFCSAVGRADLASDDRFATITARSNNRGELETILAKVIRTRTALQWRRVLDAAGVPSEVAFNTLDGEAVLFDEENVALGLVTQMEHPDLGRLRQFGHLIRFSDTPSVIHRPPPRPGQHTIEIMNWLGYDQVTIDQLISKQVIASSENMTRPQT